jgi:hypothetical protein
MLLLNISDIHFRHPFCNSAMDPEKPYRTRLVQDARAMTQNLGAVDAILVGGDIAFRGAEEEYTAAWEWLKELADAVKCPPQRIYVVPRNVQSAIANATNKERELHDQFHDPEAGRSLLAPIGPYNEFAARFNCQIFAPERLFWHQDLELDECTILRIYGLTSTLLSGGGNRDEAPNRLYLSPLQTVLNPEDGVVNLVMCHHPPDWFIDGDDVDDAFVGRAAIHILGHKHRQRIRQDTGFVRFSAGAVNPDRQELGWDPGYNLIRLSTSVENGERSLNVEGHLRSWQTNPEMFRPKMASREVDVFRHKLRIYGSTSRRTMAMGAGTGAPSRTIDCDEPACSSESVLVEKAMSDEKTRNLVFRFWDLASSERREIATELGLLQDEEIRLPEAERYGRALVRASERGLLERVADEIEKKERH